MATLGKHHESGRQIALAHRLGVYYKNTAPLLDFYREQGKLKSVDGMAPVETVTAQVAAVLDGVRA